MTTPTITAFDAKYEVPCQFAFALDAPLTMYPATLRVSYRWNQGWVGVVCPWEGLCWVLVEIGHVDGRPPIYGWTQTEPPMAEPFGSAQAVVDAAFSTVRIAEVPSVEDTRVAKDLTG